MSDSRRISRETALFWGGWTRVLAMVALLTQVAEAGFDLFRGEFLSTALPRLLIVSVIAYGAWRLAHRPLFEFEAGPPAAPASSKARRAIAPPRYLMLLLSSADRARLLKSTRPVP